ncbi:50S ribosomal protein L11 methyltransferase [Halomonas sp. V046]|uniref:50S ribosomal protein L11 methyltransferase n=1 Tax=Halomonas sp. V046 TaxID=3459611 RepID=UPI00404463B7
MIALSDEYQRKKWSDLVQHRFYLSDGVRNDAFTRAIENAVDAESTVLDVGAGSGIFSLVSARSGAREVVAVEWSSLAERIDESARRNGYGDVVNVICEDIRNLVVGRPPDVVVHELIGGFLWDENFIEILDYVRKNIADNSTQFIPSVVSLYIAPFSADGEIDRLFWSEKHEGFDFSSLENVATQRPWVEVPTVVFLNNENGFLARPRNVWRWDSRDREPNMRRIRARFVAHRNGTLDGFIGFFRIEVCGGICIETRPREPVTSWGQMAIPPMRRVSVKKGDSVSFCLTPSRWPMDWNVVSVCTAR